jgi:hypothetical protein
MSIATTSRYPLYQPHFNSVFPIMYWPTAEPKVPVPSIIPVTVDVALSFPRRDSCYPRSAAQAEDIKLLSPLMKKPNMNIRKKKRGGYIPMTLSYKVKAIADANITARKATGERLP